MITNYKELKEWLSYEKQNYPLRLFDIVVKNQMYYNWKYLRLLRYCEYYRNTKQLIFLPIYILTRLRRNLLGKKIGIEIGENSVGKGLIIYHNGSIVINKNSKIGKNLKLHGCNCIGNLGKEDNNCPIIGDNVDFGVGSIAIGNIKIADNVKIGANATVVKDCLAPGATLVGTPAKPLIKEMK